MANTVVVDDVEIEYNGLGSGPPLVFVHGIFVTGALWDDVATRLSGAYRCIMPTWPFGGQRKPVGPSADIGVEAAGRRILKLLEVLDLSDVTLVVNDTGGGIVLAALGSNPQGFDRVTRLVLTNCDSFEHFPPSGFAPIVRLFRLSTKLGAGILRLAATKKGMDQFASQVTRHGIDKARRSEIFGGFPSSAEVRREAVRLTADLHPRYTLAATTAINAWEKPVLVAWGNSDKLFPVSHAERLADAFPNAVLHIIDDGSTYVMLDQPDETVSAITEFIENTPS